MRLLWRPRRYFHGDRQLPAPPYRVAEGGPPYMIVGNWPDHPEMDGVLPIAACPTPAAAARTAYALTLLAIVEQGGWPSPDTPEAAAARRRSTHKRQPPSEAAG